MSSSNSPCAACKFLRRKCTQECPFAPYFPPDNPQRFACVHRVFGASNVAKLLNELSASQRDDAVKSLAYEAEARLRDPVYGCVGFISLLQQRLRQIQTDLHNAKKELATYLSPQAMQCLLANPGMLQSAGVVMPGGGSSSGHHQFPPGNPNNMPPPVFAGHGGGQLVIREPQQQEFFEAQQLAAVAAAREQQQQQTMLRNYEQQQELLRFNSGFEPVGSVALADGGVGGSGFGNHMGAPGPGPGPGPSEMSPSLALGTFDNVGSYQMQQQQQQPQQGEHHVHPHHHPIEAQLLMSPQHQSQNSQQQSQQQHSESGDGRSLGPSC
ncbi:protein ASYMMETRIC LEAVES 2-like [Gastrolobium bilobum]|uniref:protein ASYMMETRIC LEAVES 2-like n=1 Tax=Gastrolobium bilobum TaxID=150636 RepID=UPI002AB0F7D5|nr:protein ASYMMETRIC LEAVES 2-like [Gastrolobium bilobum]